MISPRTVHKHLENIYRKLGLTNRASLVALAGRSRSGADTNAGPDKDTSELVSSPVIRG